MMSPDTVSTFRWKSILGLAGLGLLYALLTILGWINGWEGRIALLVILTWSIATLRLAGNRPFTTALMTGFIGALLAIGTQFLFLSTYFENNPAYAALEMPFGLSPRMAMILLGPFNCLLAGVITGSLAWIFSRVAILIARLRGGTLKKNQ